MTEPIPLSFLVSDFFFFLALVFFPPSETKKRDCERNTGRENQRERSRGDSKRETHESRKRESELERWGAIGDLSDPMNPEDLSSSGRPERPIKPRERLDLLWSLEDAIFGESSPVKLEEVLSSDSSLDSRWIFLKVNSCNFLCFLYEYYFGYFWTDKFWLTRVGWSLKMSPCSGWFFGFFLHVFQLGNRMGWTTDGIFVIILLRNFLGLFLIMAEWDFFFFFFSSLVF